MIDIDKEPLVSLKHVGKFREVQRNGRGPAHCTIFRWAMAGKLDTVMIGGQRMTSRQAVRRMIAAANPGALPVQSPRQRKAEISAAERRLAGAGV